MKKSLPIFLLFILHAQFANAQLQKLYGTSGDNYFSKVIPDGSNFYLLGSGNGGGASISRINSSGAIQWTRNLPSGTVLNDAVLTASGGSLFFVGATLPNNSTSKGVAGVVSPSGTFSWLRTVDQSGSAESFTRVRRSGSNYVVLGPQDFLGPTGQPFPGVVLHTFNLAGTVLSKKRFIGGFSPLEIHRSLAIFPNGDLAIGGNTNSQGVILWYDNAGTLVTALGHDQANMTFVDLANDNGNGLYTLAQLTTGGSPQLIHVNQFLANDWQVTFPELTSAHQVIHNGAGEIYVVGRATFTDGIDRNVIVKILENGGSPVLDWAKTFDNGEQVYAPGSIGLAAGGNLVFADARFGNPNSLGQHDGFVAFGDFDNDLDCLEAVLVNADEFTPFFIGPDPLPSLEDQPLPVVANLTSTSSDLQQAEACAGTPCSVSLSVSTLTNCLDFKLTANPVGVSPFQFSWTGGGNLNSKNITLQACNQPETFCVTLTDGTGCTATACQTLVYNDLTPPPLTPCPPTTSVVNTLPGLCYWTGDIPTPSSLSDNCGIPILVYQTIVNGVPMPLPPSAQFQKGVHQLRCTATDFCGNVNTCDYTLTVEDKELPKIKCPFDTILVFGTVNPQGLCKKIVNGLTPVATDNCPMLGVNWQLAGATLGQGIGDASGTNFMEGVTFLTYTAIDMAGNTATCSIKITVRCDTSTCVCPFDAAAGQNLVHNGNFSFGNAGFTSGLQPTTTCSTFGDSYGIQNNFNVYCPGWPNLFDHTLGTAAGKFMCIDGSNSVPTDLWRSNPIQLVQGKNYCFSFWNASVYNSNQQNFLIEVNLLNPTTLLPVGPPIYGTNVAQTPAAVWNLFDQNFTQIQATGNYLIAIRQISGFNLFSDWGIDDICLREVEPPCDVVADFSIQNNGCGNFILTNTSTTSAPPAAPLWSNSSNAQSISVKLACGQSATYCLTVTDAAGCTDSVCKTISYTNNQPPTIICPQNTTVNVLPGKCTYSGVPPQPSVMDDCTNFPTVVCWYVVGGNIEVINQFTEFPKGTHTIHCRATDECDAMSDCTYLLTVRDNQPPTIICPQNMSILGTLDAQGNCKATVNGLPPTVSDNCPMVTYGYSIPSVPTSGAGNLNNVMLMQGNTTVTYTATDMAGLTASCTFVLNVKCENQPNSIFKCGMSVITCFSGFNPGTSTANPSGPVVAVGDIRNHATAPLGVNWATLAGNNSLNGGLYHAPTWDAQHMGQVFGVTIDGNYNIYVSSTTIYGRYMPSNFSNAAFGNVYKIDGTSGAVSLLNTLPQNTASPAGLGDIWYDGTNNQLLVSNFFDGKIYSISPTAVNATPNWTYQFPGATGSPFFTSTPGFAALGKRVWAVARQGNKMYFSVWNEDWQRNSANVKNQIYSVQLNANGQPILGSEFLELDMPDFVGQNFSSPVSDISFSAGGQMLVAERSMNADFGNAASTNLGAQAHRSRVFEFSGAGWASAKQFYVGNVSISGTMEHSNSAGGIDYGYESFNPATNPLPTKCDSMVWATGDALRFKNSNTNMWNTIPDPTNQPCGGGLLDYVYGLAGIRSAGNSNNSSSTSNYVKTKSIYIDADNYLCTGEKTQIGDVDVFKNCISCPGGGGTDSCEVMTMLNKTSPPSAKECCYSVSLKNLQGGISEICANLNTPGWVFNTSNPTTTSGYYFSQTSSQKICIKHTSGSIPVGANFPNVWTFCLAETQSNAPATQQITFDWLDATGKVVCQTKHTTECNPPVEPKDTCFVLTNFKVNCIGQGTEYCVSFTITNISGAAADGFSLGNLPNGYSFGDCGCGGSPYFSNGWYFSWVNNPLPNNASRTVCVKITSVNPVLSPTNVCFKGTLDITPNCCTAPRDWCVELKPCCDPCQDLTVTPKPLFVNDSCCYSLDVLFNCKNGFFSKVEFEITTPGVEFGWHAMPQTWNNCYTPLLNKVCIEPPLGSMTAGAYPNLFSFCLTDIDKPSEIPQNLKITFWTIGSNGQDSMACMRNLVFECREQKPFCAFITNEKIECLPDQQKYQITVTVQNISNPSFVAHYLMIGAPNIMPNPVPFTPPLPNDGSTRTVTFCYTPTPFPDPSGKLVLIYRLKDLEGDTCCNGNEYLRDTLMLPPCPGDTCKCGSFSNLSWRPAQGAQNQPIACGDLINFNCNQFFAPIVYGNFQCVGSNCSPTPPIQWVLRKLPAGNVVASGGLSGTAFSLPLLQQYFNSGGGVYELTFTGQCGTTTCPPCKILIETNGCNCDCGKFENMTWRPTQGGQAQMVNCGATLDIGCSNFDPIFTGNFNCVGAGCTTAPPVQWVLKRLTAPAATIATGNLTGGFFSMTLLNSYFSIPGNYEITFTGQCDGKTCPPCTFKIQSTGCPCYCGDFSDLCISLGNNQPAAHMKCGDTVSLACPPNNFTHQFGGLFKCGGTNCASKTQVFWWLTGPAGSFSGSTTANPYFAFNLLPTYFLNHGTYTLTLQGYCDGKPCPPCVIHFKINCPAICPCESLQFAFDVGAGFAVLSSQGGCQVCFAPRRLRYCDRVEWFFNNQPVGISFGQQSFCRFVQSGVHVVRAVITRFDGNGNICSSRIWQRTFNFNCTPIGICPETATFGNPRFSKGAVAGGLNDSGKSTDWSAPLGNPQVVEGIAGGNDAWAIRLSGNMLAGDVLAKLAPVCLEKDTGIFTMRIRKPLPAVGVPVDKTLARLIVTLHRDNQFSLQNMENDTADFQYEIAEIDLSPLDSATWYEVEMPFNLKDWAVADNCFASGNRLVVRPAIWLTNSFADFQGGAAESRSQILIDQFCLDGKIVGVDESDFSSRRLRIFPNPNAGFFTVELSEPAHPQTVLRAVDLAGRVVAEQEASVGLVRQNFESQDLPAGLYFLQMLERGKVLSVEKFVKQ